MTLGMAYLAVHVTGKNFIKLYLHGHLSECINDYGSIYGFWLFSYERYNRVLQRYSSNKHDIAVRLMRRFIYDC